MNQQARWRLWARWHQWARVSLVVCSSLTLTAGVLAVAGTAQAATANPYAPSYHHPYPYSAVPTLETHAKMQAWAAQHAAGQASTSNLIYHGGTDGIGVTTGHEKVYLVFWGNQWGTEVKNSKGDLTFSKDKYGGAPVLQEMFKGLGTNNETWSTVMTQYCEPKTGSSCGSNDPHVAYPSGGALAGVWYDNAYPEQEPATSQNLGVEAVRAAGHFGNTTASLNRDAQYFILSAPGTHPDNFNKSSFFGYTGWCAWHNWNGGKQDGDSINADSSYGDIAFTNLPYVMDRGADCKMNAVHSGSVGYLDGYTIYAGHEYAETITDQLPFGGWSDSNKQENGDKCTDFLFDLPLATGTFAMQRTWSNQADACVGGKWPVPTKWCYYMVTANLAEREGPGLTYFVARTLSYGTTVVAGYNSEVSADGYVWRRISDGNGLDVNGGFADAHYLNRISYLSCYY